MSSLPIKWQAKWTTAAKPWHDIPGNTDCFIGILCNDLRLVYENPYIRGQYVVIIPLYTRQKLTRVLVNNFADCQRPWSLLKWIHIPSISFKYPLWFSDSPTFVLSGNKWVCFPNICWFNHRHLKHVLPGTNIWRPNNAFFWVCTKSIPVSWGFWD